MGRVFIGFLQERFSFRKQDLDFYDWRQREPSLNKIEAVFKSLDGVLKDLAEDEPKKPVLALPAP